MIAILLSMLTKLLLIILILSHSLSLYLIRGMDLHVNIKMNPTLYIKDPEQSELGQRIIKNSIDMIYDIGFEDFTFKKLARSSATTEASVYRYFENKHRLLTYITTWFWSWLEYQLVFYTNNLSTPHSKIEVLIDLLLFNLEDQFLIQHIDKDKLYKIIIAESNKAYFTNHIEEDNKAKIFKPYKDLCHRISTIFNEYCPGYKYPHSLASTLIETAHHQIYFKDHLPSLTDYGRANDNNELRVFLKHMVLSILDNKQ